MKNLVLVSCLFLSISWMKQAHADPSDQIRSFCSVDSASEIYLESCSLVNLLPAHLDESKNQKVRELIDNASSVWPDTILEGEVDTSFEDLKIESVQEVYEVKTSVLLGYSIQYSYFGWEISCAKDETYDSAKPETFLACEKGRIRETLFATADMNEADAIVSAELRLDPIVKFKE